MARKHVGGWLAAISILGVALSLSGLQRLPPTERMLLSRAKQTAAASRFSASEFQWLSNSELLFERRWVSTEFPQAGLFRHNLDTSTQTHEAALQTLLCRGGTDTWRISPNGEWGLSGTAEERAPGKPSRRFYLVCRTDGTRQLRKEARADLIELRWLADSRHWIELYGKHVVPPGFRGKWGNMNNAPLQIQSVCLCDVNAPEGSRSLDVAPSSLLSAPFLVGNWGWGGHMFAITEDHYLIWQQIRFAPKSHIIIQDIGLNSAAPRHQYTITLPVGCTAIQLVFAPDGKQVLWKLAEHREAGVERQFIHHHLPRFDAKSVERMSLWVSRIDGTAMHEIGGVNHPGHNPDEILYVSGPSDPETGELLWKPPVPHTIRWAPDGKRIGFIYDRALWAVSTE